MLPARALVFTTCAVKTYFGEKVPLVSCLLQLDYASICKKSKKTENSQKRNKDLCNC